MQGLSRTFAHDVHVQQGAANGASQGLGLLGVRQNSLAAHDQQVTPQARLRQVVTMACTLAEHQIDRQIFDKSTAALGGAQQTVLAQMRQGTPYGVSIGAEICGELMLRRQLNPWRVLTFSYGGSQRLRDTRPQGAGLSRLGQQGIQKNLFCHENYTRIAYAGRSCIDK